VCSNVTGAKVKENKGGKKEKGKFLIGQDGPENERQGNGAREKMLRLI
jgi:hypothetical protein